MHSFIFTARTDDILSVIRFTDAGADYAENPFCPQPMRKISAMAALSAEDMAILVRMAHLFSQYIKRIL